MGRPRNPVTPGHLAAQWLHDHGGTFADAAAEYGVSRQAVHQQWTVLYPNEEPPGVVATSRSLDERIARYRIMAETMTRAQMAEAEGLSYDGLSWFCKRYGIEPVTVGYTDAQFAEARHLILAGNSAMTVARATGINYRTLRSRIAKGELPRTRGRVGIRNGTCAEASAYMDKHRVPITDAAAQFGVSPPALYGFRKRRGLPTTVNQPENNT